MSPFPAAVACVCIALLARAAFCAARRRTLRRLPRELTAELRRHKLECLHEPPERVELELELLLGERVPRG